MCILLHILLSLTDIASPEVHLDESAHEAEADVPSDEPMDTKSKGVFTWYMVVYRMVTFPERRFADGHFSGWDGSRKTVYE